VRITPLDDETSGAGCSSDIDPAETSDARTITTWDIRPAEGSVVSRRATPSDPTSKRTTRSGGAAIGARIVSEAPMEPDSCWDRPTDAIPPVAAMIAAARIP